MPKKSILKFRVSETNSQSQTPLSKQPTNTGGGAGTPEDACKRSGENGSSPPDLEQKCTGSGATAEDWVLKKICLDDVLVGKAVHALYNRQTPPEQDVSMTFRRNRAGFSKANARRMSRMARRFRRTGRLSKTDLAYCRAPTRNGMPRLGKYRVQLAEIFCSTV